MFGIVSGAALRGKAITLVDAFSAGATTSKSARRKDALTSAADSALQALFASVADYCRQERLGVIGRARLAKALQDELRRRGFPAEMVSKVTSAVTINALVSPGRQGGPDS